MHIKEIRTKSEQELSGLLKEMRNKLADLKFKDAQKQVKNVREIRIVKKTIARVLMVVAEKIKTAQVKK